LCRPVFGLAPRYDTWRRIGKFWLIHAPLSSAGAVILEAARIFLHASHVVLDTGADMQTLDQLLKNHPSTLRERGLNYQRERRVRILHRSASRIHATVRGTRVYSVVLEQEARVWEDSCNCPAHEDFGMCKHVCALLSELVHGAAVGRPVRGLSRRRPRPCRTPPSTRRAARE
jgi:hypothetical protein